GVDEVVGLAEGEVGVGAGAAGMDPLGLGGQAIAGARPVVGGERHAVGVLPLSVAEVTPLLFRHAVLVAEPVAVAGGFIPGDGVHRAIGRGGGFFVPGMFRRELQELRDGHLLRGDGEAAFDAALVLLGAFADPDHAGLGDDAHGQALLGDEPLALAVDLAGRQFFGGVLD